MRDSTVHQGNVNAPLKSSGWRPQTLDFIEVLRQRVAVVVQHFADILNTFFREPETQIVKKEFFGSWLKAYSLQFPQTFAQLLILDAAFGRSQEHLHDLQDGSEQFIKVLRRITA